MPLDPQQAAPDEILDSTDPGSETQRRFVYQACHLAQLALALLDDARDFDAIFCEHFDDALLKLTSNDFFAVQVKTRLDDLGPFKATDEPVLRSVAKFASLEHQFGERMRGYVLASNVGFWRERKTMNNLQHVIDCACGDGGEAALVAFVSRLKLADGCPAAAATNALKKTQLDNGLPKLRDMFTHLMRLLGELPAYSDHSIAAVREATRALVLAIREASEAVVEGAGGAYVAYEGDPTRYGIDAVLKEKRFTRERVEKVLTDATQHFMTLKSAQNVAFPPPVGTTRLEKKLAAGGVSYGSVNSMKDLKTSAEYEFTRRIARDTDRAARDYEHVHVLVQAAGAEAHDAVASAELPYGTAMLNELRTRTLALAANAADARGLPAQLLQGVAAILTEECTLWWSDPFEVDETQA